MLAQRIFHEKYFSLREVVAALTCLRVPVALEEYEIQHLVARQLDVTHIPYQREYLLGPQNRIDFFIPGGIGIEVKKGKPPRVRVLAQLQRYTNFSEINAVILIIERCLVVPEEINGKPCVSFSLNKLWGVAI